MICPTGGACGFHTIWAQAETGAVGMDRVGVML